jgi:chaperone required for assembly of F1-ATPase
MKRFWKGVSVDERGGGWRVLLDGRPIRTQGSGVPQVVPTRALAELLAAEWAAQGEDIDGTAFPLRDLADYALDIVANAKTETVEKLLRYAETDTLCYRAHPDEPLWQRQHSVWEPLVTAFEAREGVRMERISGILHRPLSPETQAGLRARLEALDPFALAALETLTSLSASLCVGLSSIEAGADPERLWSAAELEEAWQVELWGSDAQAEERRARRRSDFLRAVGFARALGDH